MITLNSQSISELALKRFWYLNIQSWFKVTYNTLNTPNYILLLEHKPLKTDELITTTDHQFCLGRYYNLYSCGIHCGYLFEALKTPVFVVEENYWSAAKQDTSKLRKNIAMTMQNDLFSIIESESTAVVVSLFQNPYPALG
jgi:hypothetical protein